MLRWTLARGGVRASRTPESAHFFIVKVAVKLIHMLGLKRADILEFENYLAGAVQIS
jgi:hypothetical protein